MARTRSDISHRIVHAARARFLHDGVDGASLRTIAKDAKTSLGMIYYYFPTKDDLFLAVVEAIYGRVLEDFATALAGDAPFEVRIGRLYARIGAMSEEEFTTFRLVLREALVSSERLSRLIERFSRGHIPLILSALADGIAEGKVDGTLPPISLIGSTFALGFVPQVVRRLWSAALPLELAPPERIAQAQLDVLLSGIGAAEPGARQGERAREPARPAGKRPAKAG